MIGEVQSKPPSSKYPVTSPIFSFVPHLYQQHHHRTQQVYTEDYRCPHICSFSKMLSAIISQQCLFGFCVGQTGHPSHKGIHGQVWHRESKQGQNDRVFQLPRTLHSRPQNGCFGKLGLTSIINQGIFDFANISKTYRKSQISRNIVFFYMLQLLTDVIYNKSCM